MPPEGPVVFFAFHKGDDTFMSDKQRLFKDLQLGIHNIPGSTPVDIIGDEDIMVERAGVFFRSKLTQTFIRFRISVG